MKCPECERDLGEPVSDTLTSIAWHCGYCKIKIYKELE